MRALFISFAVAMLMAACGGSATADSQTNMAAGLTEVSAPAQPLKDPVTCRTQQAPKSKMSMILCARTSEWARRTREDRDMLERLERRNAH